MVKYFCCGFLFRVKKNCPHREMSPGSNELGPFHRCCSSYVRLMAVPFLVMPHANYYTKGKVPPGCLFGGAGHFSDQIFHAPRSQALALCR